MCLSNKDKDINDPKNHKKNLRLLAAQCLLLASKFNEVQRIYPAEVVHQIKDWNSSEFEVLKSGSIEEYILNTLDFDLMFLSPIDFFDIFVGCWGACEPECAKVDTYGD